MKELNNIIKELETLGQKELSNEVKAIAEEGSVKEKIENAITALRKENEEKEMEIEMLQSMINENNEFIEELLNNQYNLEHLDEEELEDISKKIDDIF